MTNRFRVASTLPGRLEALAQHALFKTPLHRLERYKLLTCPEKVEISESADECCVRFTRLSTDEPKPALPVDGCFAWILAIGHRGIGRMLCPERVEFQRPAAHREMYRAHFQCPVKFGAPHNLLAFRHADVDEPFVTHNADLLGVVAPQLEAELTEQLAGTTIGEQTKSALKRIIAGRRPVLQDAARELRLSARTLQRRLTQGIELPTGVAGRSPRTSAFLHRVERNRVSTGLRRPQFFLPGFPPLGGKVARQMARQSHDCFRRYGVNSSDPAEVSDHRVRQDSSFVTTGFPIPARTRALVEARAGSPLSGTGSGQVFGGELD